MDEQFEVDEPMPLGAKLWVAGFGVMVVLAVGVVVAARSVPDTLAMTTVEGIERLGALELPVDTEIIEARYSAPAAS